MSPWQEARLKKELQEAHDCHNNLSARATSLEGSLSEVSRMNFVVQAMISNLFFIRNVSARKSFLKLLVSSDNN